jgi:hypothetical protein
MKNKPGILPTGLEAAAVLMAFTEGESRGSYRREKAQTRRNIYGGTKVNKA